MVKRKKTSEDRGIKIFNGKKFNHHCRTKSRASAERKKREMLNTHYVRIVRSGDKLSAFSVWIRSKRKRRK